MNIGLIVAYDKNRLIGNNNSLPWKIKEEMSIFKKITTDQIVIMGRKTYESIGKPLINRLNLVIGSKIIDNEHVYTFLSIEDCLNFCKKINLNKKIILIGGLSLYEYFLNNNLINYMYVSKIKNIYEGNLYFPDINENTWNKTLYFEGEEFDTWLYKLN